MYILYYPIVYVLARLLMAHTQKHKEKLLIRVRRIKGQITSLEKLLDSGGECGAVLQQLAAVRGALNGLMAEVIEGHVIEHIVSDELSQKERTEGGEDLLEVVRRYFK